MGVLRRATRPQTVKNFVPARAHGSVLRRPRRPPRGAELRDPGRRPDRHRARAARLHHPLRSTTGCSYDAGMVGMALSGKDTGGSQWFITHSPQLALRTGATPSSAHVTRGLGRRASRSCQGDRILRVVVLGEDADGRTSRARGVGFGFTDSPGREKRLRLLRLGATAEAWLCTLRSAAPPLRIRLAFDISSLVAVYGRATAISTIRPSAW